MSDVVLCKVYVYEAGCWVRMYTCRLGINRAAGTMEWVHVRERMLGGRTRWDMLISRGLWKRMSRALTKTYRTAPKGVEDFTYWQGWKLITLHAAPYCQSSQSEARTAAITLPRKSLRSSIFRGPLLALYISLGALYTLSLYICIVHAKFDRADASHCAIIIKISII